MESQTKSGAAVSVDERMERLDQELREIDEKIGVPTKLNSATENEITKILNYSPEQVRRLTPDECGEAAFMLQQFAFFLQKIMNEEQAKLTFVEESIKRMIAPQLCQQRGSSVEERKLLAVRNNDAAQKLDVIRVTTSVKLHKVSFLSGKCDAMAKSLLSLQATKRGKQ